MQGAGNLKLFIDKETIDKKVRELGRRITKDYSGKVPIFIGVLNGAFVFLSDLIRHVNLDTEVDFLKLSSYGDRKISSGNIRLIKDLNCELAKRDIIVVEDIIDSGLSIKFIHDLIANHEPSSLEFAALLIKKRSDNISFKIKYTGFRIPDKFVVGYGLDCAQKYRNLKSIYIVN